MNEAESTECAAAAHDPFALGAVVAGRYRLQRVLGRGAAAVVFAAEHTYTRRSVALKLPLMHPDLGELLRARLRRESYALSCVRHPVVVDIVDAGEIEPPGLPYLAMQLLEGRTLSGLIAARGKLSTDEVVKLGVALAQGLQAVHAASLVHRDVKPANVLITHAPDDQVHLCDFGIAKLHQPHESSHAKLTQAGAILGTPEYMPMEAFVSVPEADHRVDVYALGVTLFECLTGAVPFEGPIGQILLRLSTGQVPHLSQLRADVPAALADAVMRCLAPEPAARFQDMREVVEALRGCASEPLERVDLLRVGKRSPEASLTAADAAQPTAARRGHTRAPYVALASLQREGGAVHDARIEDLSEGGVLLVMQQACEQGEHVRLRFGLPISGRAISVGAVVRWSRRARGAPAVGLEFRELPASAREEIQRYVALVGV